LGDVQSSSSWRALGALDGLGCRGRRNVLRRCSRRNVVCKENRLEIIVPFHTFVNNKHIKPTLNKELLIKSHEAIERLKEVTCDLLKIYPDGLQANQIGKKLEINFDVYTLYFRGFLPHYLILKLLRDEKIVPKGEKKISKQTWQLKVHTDTNHIKESELLEKSKEEVKNLKKIIFGFMMSDSEKWWTTKEIGDKVGLKFDYYFNKAVNEYHLPRYLLDELELKDEKVISTGVGKRNIKLWQIKP
jgi:hypothetical protein